MARHFTTLLCALKHSGAVDKAQQGFGALCERLLQESDPALRALPQRCLADLLAFAARPGQGRADIVRRSAGLPFGVVAIFYAEPDSGRKPLLRYGMSQLLAAAGDLPQYAAHSWPRVHALNCLRAAFLDGSLAVDVSAHLAPAMRAALLAMAAPQWEVRNAASLAFTALLVRVLGVRNAAGQGTAAAKRAPTVADFFARHPQLHPFLLGQLSAATDALGAGGEGSGGEGSGSGGGGGEGSGSSGGGGGPGAMHPSLFPVLVLLSRLRPSRHSHLAGSSGSSALAEERLSPAAFVPLLRRCAACAALAVRRLAAAALPPLLAPEVAPAAAGDAADAVAAAVGAAGECGEAGRGERQQAQHAQQRGKPSFNALHGQLLQLRALLEAAAAGGDAPAAEALLRAAAPPLARCAAAACALGPGSCLPAAVAHEYLRTAEAAAALLRGLQQQHQLQLEQHAQRGDGREPPPEPGEWRVTRNWLDAVEARCWEALDWCNAQAEAPPDWPSPMLSCALKHAAQLAFTLLLQRGRPCWEARQDGGQPGGQRGQQAQQPDGAAAELQLRLEAALASPAYEVRGAALKVLLRHLQPAQQRELDAAQQALQPPWQPGAPPRWLRRALRRRLPAEPHHKARRRLLAALALLPLEAEGEDEEAPSPANLEEEFESMLRLATATPDARAREHTVRCLGPLLARLPRRAGGAPAAAGRLLSALAGWCAPTQPTELRAGALAALAASGLLSADPHASAAAAEAAAGAWELLLRLVEDDEEAVREAAAAAAADAAAGFGAPSLSAARVASAGSSSLARGVRSSSAAALAAALAAVDAEPAAPAPERTLRRTLPALGSRFGAHPALLSLLSRLCCTAPGAAEGTAAAAAARAAAAAERLFDRELDNLHEEPLLLAQLAAGTLARLLPRAGVDDGGAAAARAWALAAAGELRRVAGALAADDVAQQGAGEASPVQLPHHRLFEPLYRAWLALWVAAHLPRGEEDAAWERELAAAVAELGAGPAGPAAASAAAPQAAGVAAAALEAWARRSGGGRPDPDAVERLLFLV